MFSLAQPMIWDCLIAGLLLLGYLYLLFIFDGNHGNQVVLFI
jgi:hypothetical protein